MKFEKIKGLIPAVFTPMDKDGELNIEVIPPYAEMLKKNGLSGVFVAGSSGEGLLLTVEERMRLTEAWSLHTGDDFKLIVHVGCASYRESQELAVHAAAHHAWAISVMGPVFFQPQRVDQLVEYCGKIAGAVPEMPFYYYHIPGRSGVNLSMKDFLDLGSERIPNLAGLKFSHSDFMELQQCLMAGDRRFDVLFGFDHLLLCALPFGVKGAIGTTFNFMSGIYYRIMDAFKAGRMEEARELQYKTVQLVETLLRFGGGVAAFKAIMGLGGLDCGPCRSPLENLSGKDRDRMERELVKMDFFDSIANFNL